MKEILAFLLQKGQPNLYWIIIITVALIILIMLLLLLRKKQSEAFSAEKELQTLKIKEEENSKQTEQLTKEKNRLLFEIDNVKKSSSPQETESSTGQESLFLQNKELIFLSKDYLINDFLGLVKQYFPQKLELKSSKIELNVDTERKFEQILLQLDKIEKLAPQYTYHFPLDYYYQKMIYCVGLRNFEQLEIILRETLAFYPQNKDLHFFQIRILTIMYRDKECLEQLESFLELHPGEIDAREILVKILIRQNSYKKAETECRKLMELKLDRSYKALLGYIYYLQGFLSKSEEIYEELSTSPENDLCQLYLARIDEDQGRIKEAQTRYHKLYNSGCRDQDLLKHLIHANSQFGQNGQNKKIFEEVRKNADIDAELIISYLHSTILPHQEFLSIYNYLKDLSTQRGTDYKMFDALGVLLIKYQKFNEAKTAFEKSHSLQESGRESIIQLARLEMDDKNLPIAKEYIDQFSGQWPHDSEGQILLALYQRLSGDIDSAKKTLSEIANKDPGHIELYPSLGQAYLKLQDYPEALFYFTKLEETKHHSETLFQDIAFTYYSLNQFDDAVEYYHKVLEINNKNLDAYNNIGVIYSARNEFKKAKKYFHEAIQINPESIQTNYNLALLYKKINQENSVKYYAKYKELIKEGTSNGQNA